MDFKSLTYTTFNELRTTSGVDGSSVKVLGKAVDNDGFGGIFYWDNSSTLPDDNFNVIQKTGLLQGRWKRLMFPGGGGDSGSYVGGPGIDIVGNVISNSVYLDDIVSSSFNTGTGDLILTTRGGVDIVTNLDGRYLTSSTDAQTLSWNEALSELSISNGNTVELTGLLTLTALSATAPISYNSTTGVFSISQAGPTTDGYLSAEDWNSFNNKQDPLGYIPENVANKTVNFNSPNHATYPSTQAVVDYIDSFDFGGVTSVDIADTAYITWSGGPITTSGVFTPILNSNLQGWGNLDTAAKEDSINKVTNFDSPNNTTFPTTQAVVDYLDDIDTGGTVTSVDIQTGTVGLSITGSPITTSGTIFVNAAMGYRIPTAQDTIDWTEAFRDNIRSGSFNTSTGILSLVSRTMFHININMDGRYMLSSDLDDYYTKTELQTSGQSSVHWDNITNTPDFMENDLTVNAPLVYNSALNHMHITAASASSDGFLTIADWIRFNNKADAFSTGNLIAGDGVSFTGSGLNRLFGSGDLTIEAELPDLSGYVASTRTITIQGQAKDLSQDREWSLTTTDIPEGTNLYFTTSRARNSLSAGPGISYDPLTGIISNSAQGEEIELIEGANIIITGTAPSFTIAADLSNYYSKDDLETSGDSSVHWDNITDVPDFMENDLTVNAPLVYNPTLNHMHITAASGTSNGFLTIADWLRFDGKADAFSTGNLVAGTGVSFTGTGLNRLFGVGDLTINLDADLSGYVPTSRTLTINGTTYDLSDDRTWTIPVADGSETKINAGTGVTVTGSGTTGNPYVISSPYQTLSWNNTTKTISISNGNSQILTGLVSSDVSITNSYGINIGGDLDTGLSIGLDTTVVDLRYLRKDIDDSNGSNKLTLGELEAGPSEITGTLTLGSVASGPMTNNFLTIDPVTGEVEQTPLSVEISDLVIADGAGTPQFDVDLASEDLKFVGTGDTSVSFNAATNTITINSVPGQGGGGAVTSFNGRDGAVVSITGDYNTSQVTETTNLYFTEPRVLSTVLTGFTPTFGTVTSTDTVLSAFEKLQSQLDYKTSINTTLTVNGTSNRVVVSGGTQSLNANRVWTVDLAPIGAGGTYTKVSIDPFGRVILGEYLSTSDLPISAGSGIAISPTGVISNTSQDQTVTITGTGLTNITGSYPNFTVNTPLIAGAGINITGNTISATATAPDLQTVTDVGNTTDNILQITGANGVTSSDGLILGYVDAQSVGTVIVDGIDLLQGNTIGAILGWSSGASLTLNHSDSTSAFNTTVAGLDATAPNHFVTLSQLPDISNLVPNTRTITAGNGLTGGGDLTGDRTITLGNPGSITATSTNAVTATSHTHELAANSVVTAKILNSNVTFAKIQNIPTQTLIGRYSTGTGVAQSITLGTGLNLNASGVLSATNTTAGTVSSVSSTVGGTALSVAVTNPTTTPNLAFDWEGTTAQYVTGAGTLVTFPSIPQGTVTSITIGNGLTGTSPITSAGTITLGNPSSITLSSTNSVTAGSHTHEFNPGGTTSQYIRGNGTLATFPTIPTVNNGTLTLSTTGIATGSASFTANQSGNSSFTVNVPGTNLGSSLSGNNLTITSSTGANTTVDLSGLASVTPNLQQVTDVNNVTDNALRVTGFTNPSGATTGMIISYDATSQASTIKHNGATVFQSDNSSVGVVAPNNQTTGIVATGDVVQIVANGTAFFVLTGTSGSELAGFNTRVQGLDAVNSDEFITLGQLNSSIPTDYLSRTPSSTGGPIQIVSSAFDINTITNSGGFASQAGATNAPNAANSWAYLNLRQTSDTWGRFAIPTGGSSYGNAQPQYQTRPGVTPWIPFLTGKSNVWQLDEEGNERIYLGTGGSGFAAGFKAATTTQAFAFQSSTGSTVLSVHANTGNITASSLAGSGNRMVVANASGILSTQAIPVNTTYSAGSGLTLTGTTFSLPVTISGSGTFVQSVAQNANGITVTLGTPSGTTYTGSTSITLSGSSFQRAALTGDVTAPANSNTTTIANNAVTTAKIANGAVTNDKVTSVAWTKITGAPVIPTQYLSTDLTVGTEVADLGSYNVNTVGNFSGTSYSSAFTNAPTASGYLHNISYASGASGYQTFFNQTIPDNIYWRVKTGNSFGDWYQFASREWVNSQIPAAQTLSLGADPGDLSISGGNSVDLTSLDYNSRNDADNTVYSTGFQVYYATGATGYPVSAGGGYVFKRLPGTNLGGLDIFQPSNNSWPRFRFGASASTWSVWNTFASQEWVAGNFVTTNTTQTGLSGNKTWTGTHNFSTQVRVGTGTTTEPLTVGTGVNGTSARFIYDVSDNLSSGIRLQGKNVSGTNYYADFALNPQSLVAGIGIGTTGASLPINQTGTNQLRMWVNTSGDLFSERHMYVGNALNVASLAGTGNRMVVAQANGTLTTSVVPDVSIKWDEDFVRAKNVASADANTSLPTGGAVASYSSNNWLANGPTGFTYGGLLDISGLSGRQSLQLAWSSGHAGEADSRLAYRTEYGTSGGSYRSWREIPSMSDLDNFITTNTNQSGMTGNKTTNGTWLFRYSVNNWYLDGEANERMYIGGASTTHAHIFKASGTLQYFRFRGASNTDIFTINSNSGQLNSSSLTGSGTRMMVANAAGTILTQAIPSSGVTQITAGNGMNFTTITGTGAVTMGTPGSITASSTNSVSATSHTHALANSSITTAKIANNAVTTNKIADDAVIFDKIVDISTQTLLGRHEPGSGNVQEVTLGAGLTLNTTTGVLDTVGGSGGWFDEMGYDYEGNDNNTAKGLDTRGGYATRPFVFITNSTIPDDVETCIFIGDKAILTIPDPALYENRIISIINRGGAVLDLAGYLPIINVTVSATINELIAYYPGISTGFGANSLEIQSIYNPITSTYIWVVLHFHFSNLQV